MDILILQVAGYLIITFLLLSGIYFLVFAICSHFYQEKDDYHIANYKKKVAILIPAYKEDHVIIETAYAARKHHSELANCEVIVIADQLRSFTTKVLKHCQTTVIPVSFSNSSKSKAIKYALSQLSTNYDYTIVLDADNIMAPFFIDNIIRKLDQGYKIVQGRRMAKNKNTHIATLDAISEAVNNAIFRSGHRAIGFSASLIGSGFAADYNFFKTLIDQCSSIGGFDKELEIMITQQNEIIGYSQKAIVFDEKIQDAGSFVNQRRRWLSAQFVYLSSAISNVFKGAVNINSVDKIFQFLLPPRIMSIGLSLILTLMMSISQIYSNHFTSLFWLSLTTFVVNILAVVTAIPKAFYTKSMLTSLQLLPKGFFLTMLALLKIKNANKQFLHTTHGISDNK